MSRPCVFLDRDGIVNRPPPDHVRYVLRWTEFEFMPDFMNLLQVIRGKGYPAVVVTNQRGVGRGRMSEADLREIHDNLLARLRAEDLDILDILFCPHDDDEHPDRKPNPGMLLTAAARHNLDLPASWMIGDSERDVEAGRRAGCRTILVSPAPSSAAPTLQVAGLPELIALLQKTL